MARSTQQIYDSMVAEAVAKATADGNTKALGMLANTSKVAIWRLLFYVCAFSIFVFEGLLDAFQVAVDEKLAQLKPHNLNWYRNKVKAFQYGFTLVVDTDLFDNTGKTDSQIAASLVVKYASCVEETLDDVRVLLVKVATLSGDELVPLTSDQYDALMQYIKVFKDAGVRVVVYNQVADLIRCTVDVYVDPMLLDDQGLRTDGAGYPVKDAAMNYPLELEFDGEFINAGFIDKIQSAYGVSRRKVNLISIERQTVGGNWQQVPSSFTPNAGYAKFATNGLTINYLADV